jgi:hypothetical protein
MVGLHDVTDKPKQGISFTFMWPCIATNFFTIKPTRSTNFPNLLRHETWSKFGKLVHLVGFIIKKRDFLVNGITRSNKIYRSKPTPGIRARTMTLQHKMPQPQIEVLTVVAVMKFQDLWEMTLCSLVNV